MRTQQPNEPTREGDVDNFDDCKVSAYITLSEDSRLSVDMDELLFYEAACGCEDCQRAPVPLEYTEELGV